MSNAADHLITLTPWRGTARVWHGETLLAETDGAVVLEETRHGDRLYVPTADVRWNLFDATDVHTRCPYKGVASYWSLRNAGTEFENSVWAYPEPIDSMPALADLVCFYEDRYRVELVERFPRHPDAEEVVNRFPAWGDATDLLALLDVQPNGDGRFTSPPYPKSWRNVVEGGHQLAQGVIAAAKSVPGQRPVSAHMVFSKAASFDTPLDIEVDMLRQGRSFSTVQVRTVQDGSMRSAGIVLLDASPGDTLRHDAPMPDVPGPNDAVPLEMWVTGRDLRVVNADYDPDPDRVGPPAIYTWCRFRESPPEASQHAALMAQSTTHWTIAAGMLPHPGFGEAQAHVSLSTGVMAATVTFLDEVDVSDWLLYTNHAVYAGRGLVQGEGRIYSIDGRLVGTHTIQTIVRQFHRDPSGLGLDVSNAM